MKEELLEERKWVTTIILKGRIEGFAEETPTLFFEALKQVLHIAQAKKDISLIIEDGKIISP